ncbi:MAG TPA: MlaD family protein [Methylomirabilota bacterium]|jgi:phospholipid/cholesterol/gamma-HCH transport system substrate-binding protein|nr:MlaD family protein [Methylomirabilota bacterium]
MNEEGNERGRKLRVGVFVLVGVAAFLSLIYALGARARLFEPRFTVHAEFTEVGGLVEGATVRLAGVQIGRVSGVNLPPEPGGKVRIDMTIAKRYGNRVRKDSVARIETQGLLGDRIIEITVGSAQAPPVGPDEVLASREPFDFTKVMSESAGVVKNVSALAESLQKTAETLNQSGLIEEAAATVKSARKITDQVGRVVHEVERGKGLAHALVYDEPVALRKLDRLVASTQALVERIERGEGAAGVLTSEQSTVAARRFVAAMDRLSRVVEQPSAEDGVLPALLFDPKYRAMLDDARVLAHNLREVSDRLVGGRGTIGALVKDEPADASIRQTSRDLQATMANLKDITEKINSGEGTVGALIADPTVYERLVSILDGASRSFLLRGLMRGLGGNSTSKDGASRPGDGTARDGAAKDPSAKSKD